jgi:hypothetical protein
MRNILVILFSLICFSSLSQTTYPNVLPTPKSDSGFAQYGYVRPLVLGHMVIGDTMIRPKYSGATRLWFHAGVDTAIWAWSTTKWVKIASGGSGGGGGSGVQSVTGISPIEVDNTDPLNPIVSTTDTGTVKVFLFQYPIQAEEWEDTVLVYLDTVNVGDIHNTHHTWGFYITQFASQTSVDSILIYLDTMANNFLDTAYYSSGLTTDTFRVEKNGEVFSWYVLDKVQDGILSGGQISWVEDLIYEITPAVYRINGVRYTSDAQRDTLDAADATYPRIDAFYLDTSEDFGDITGEASDDPFEPTVDPATQLRISFAQVNPANDTLPEGITETIVWDENLGTPDEFNYTNGAGLTTNPNNTTNPYHLTKAIDVNSWLNTGTRTMTFTDAAPFDLTAQGSLLKFRLDLKDSLPALSNIQIRFWNGAVAVSPAITLNSTYGFTKTDIGYQNITIPFFGIAWTGTMATRIILTVTGAGPGFYTDYW